MTEAALAAKSLLAMLGTTALHGSVLAILAAILVRPGKLRPAWHAAVWTIVIVKFAVPWGPAMPWSLADVLATLRGNAGGGGPIVVGAPGVPEAAAAQVSGGWLVLAALWAVGAAWVIARAAIRSRGARRAARAAVRAPADAVALLVSIGGGRARLVVGAPSVGPHVLGLIRPTIVIPPALLDDRELLRAALLHELAHVRRLDALGRILQIAARAAFWWLPVVAFASRRLDHAREAACDARALEIGRIPRQAYARLLLQMAQLRPAAASSLAATALDDRITGVLGPPMRARLGILHGVALLAWGAIALGGARSAHARRVETCVYSPELAAALRQAHPEADTDKDGVLSHDEACEFQAQLRRAAETPAAVSTLDEASAELLAEPLCCNSDVIEGISLPTGPEQSCRAE